MKLSLVNKHDAPERPWTCVLVEFIPESVPYVLYALWLAGQKYWWTDEENAERGRQLLAEVASRLLMSCSADIVERLDKLYRQQEAIHRGTVYTYTGEGTQDSPYVVEPSIPIVPATADGEEPSTLFYLAKAVRLWDNFVNGTAYNDAPDVRKIRDQLDTVISLIGQGGYDDTEVRSLLQLIILALG